MPEISCPLQTACGMGRFEIVKLLLEKGADCNLVYKGIWGSKSCLSYAVLSGADESEQIIQLLLQNGADKDYVDECGKKAYDYAAESDNVELQELLR